MHPIPSLFDPRIDFRYFTEGGTLITSIEPAKQLLYELAITEFGDPDLILVPNSVGFLTDSSGRQFPYTFPALHYLKRPVDIQGFWVIFYRLERAYNLIKSEE